MSTKGPYLSYLWGILGVPLFSTPLSSFDLSLLLYIVILHTCLDTRSPQSAFGASSVFRRKE